MFAENIQSGDGKPRFALVSVPIWYGVGKRGTEFGPAVLRKFFLDEKLRTKGVKIIGWYDVVPDAVKSHDSGCGKVKYESEIFYTHNSTFRLLRGFLGQGIVPIILGGDHTISIASVAAHAITAGSAAKIGVIWIDAHGDVHTPDTSPTGNVHGMPLAILLGHGTEKLLEIGGDFQRKVYPQNVVHIGANSIEDEEAAFFTRHRIPFFPKKEIDTPVGFARACDAITALGKRVQTVVVSIDMDAFDKKDAPGVHYQNPDGIDREKALLLFEHIKTTCCIGGIDIAEFVRRKDKSGKTIQLLHDILACLMVS